MPQPRTGQQPRGQCSCGQWASLSFGLTGPGSASTPWPAPPCGCRCSVGGQPWAGRTSRPDGGCVGEAGPLSGSRWAWHRPESAPRPWSARGPPRQRRPLRGPPLLPAAALRTSWRRGGRSSTKNPCSLLSDTRKYKMVLLKCVSGFYCYTRIYTIFSNVCTSLNWPESLFQYYGSSTLRQQALTKANKAL